MKTGKDLSSYNNKLNILIVDDIDSNINNCISKLIPIAPNSKDFIYQDEAKELSEKFYNIKRYNVVGDAINYWEGKEGRYTDVAIIDFDFSSLKPGLPPIEYGESRGADLMKLISLQKTTSLFCLTIYRKKLKEVEGIINEETQYLDKKNIDYDPKYQKLLVTKFKEHALSHFNAMEQSEKIHLYTMLNKNPIESILQYTIISPNGRFKLKYLLIPWAEIFFDTDTAKPTIKYLINSTDLLKILRDDKQNKNPHSG